MGKQSLKRIQSPDANPVPLQPLRYRSTPPAAKEPEEIGLKIGALVESSLSHASIELDAEKVLSIDAVTLAGLRQLNDSSPVVIESGTARKKIDLITRFEGTPVLGMTTPGQPKENGSYPDNMDGISIIPDIQSDSLSIFMTNVEGYEPEEAALSKAAIVTATYEAAKYGELLKGQSEAEKMDQVFQYADYSTSGVRNEFGMDETKKVNMICAKLIPNRIGEYYDLIVANNGNSHCLIINPATGEYRSATQGVRKPGSEKAVEKPVTSDFICADNPYIVLASDSMVEAYGSEENLAKTIIERVKDYNNPGIFRKMMLEVDERQNNGELVSSSLSLVAFKVPKYKPSDYKGLIGM